MVCEGLNGKLTPRRVSVTPLIGGEAVGKVTPSGFLPARGWGASTAPGTRPPGPEHRVQGPTHSLCSARRF